MAKHRYGRKRKGRKSAKRRRAGKKAWATRRRRYGAHGAKRGGKRRARRGTKRKVRRGGLKIAYCSVGKCARRPIFGGAKGLATHRKRHHRR